MNVSVWHSVVFMCSSLHYLAHLWTSTESGTVLCFEISCCLYSKLVVLVVFMYLFVCVCFTYFFFFLILYPKWSVIRVNFNNSVSKVICYLLGEGNCAGWHLDIISNPNSSEILISVFTFFVFHSMVSSCTGTST